MNRPKVPVTERAIIQRINRKLRQQSNPEALRASRNDRQAEELGAYYIVESGLHGQPRKAASAGVVRVHVNVEKLGRELGVLQPWETVEAE